MSVLSEVDQRPIPNLVLAQEVFRFSQLPAGALRDAVLKSVLKTIEDEEAGPFYEFLCETYKVPRDPLLAQRLAAANEKTLTDLAAKIADAKVNLGESEVREFHAQRSDYLCKIGDKDASLKAISETYDLTVGVGQRIDLVLKQIRIGLFWADSDLIRRHIAKAANLLEGHPDWDRKNRLKVYEGTYFMMIRDFTRAANKFLDSIATFTCTEMFDYNQFMFYAIVVSVCALERPALRDKVIEKPEVLAVIHEIPNLKDFLFSLYKCKYSDFFANMVSIIDRLKEDRYLSVHSQHLCREYRVIAYRQFLQSYRSVDMAAMAKAFGVGVRFLDAELSRFIAAHRLSCKIDKVNGVLETTQADSRNTQYAELIKHGDLLANRIQKLSRVVNV